MWSSRCRAVRFVSWPSAQNRAAIFFFSFFLSWRVDQAHYLPPPILLRFQRVSSRSASKRLQRRKYVRHEPGIIVSERHACCVCRDNPVPRVNRATRGNQHFRLQSFVVYLQSFVACLYFKQRRVGLNAFFHYVISTTARMPRNVMTKPKQWRRSVIFCIVCELFKPSMELLTDAKIYASQCGARPAKLAHSFVSLLSTGVATGHVLQPGGPRMSLRPKHNLKSRKWLFACPRTVRPGLAVPNHTLPSPLTWLGNIESSY